MQLALLLEQLLLLLYILPCSASSLPHAVTSFYLRPIWEAGEMLPPCAQAPVDVSLTLM